MLISIPLRRLAPLLLAGSLLSAAPTVEEIFRKPAVIGPMIAEDGKWLAYSVFDEKDKEQDDYGISLLNLESGDTQAFMVAGKSTFPVGWLTDTKLVVGAERQGYSVYDVRKKKALSFNMRERFSIISFPEEKPGLINVWFSEYDSESRTGPALINPATGAARASGQSADRYNVVEWIETPEGERHGFIDDLQGRILGTAIWKDKVMRYFVRTSESAPWVMLNLDAHDDTLFGFTADHTKVYVSHAMPDDDAPCIYFYDLASQSFGEKIFGLEGCSMQTARLYFSHQDYTLLGVSYDADFPKTHWFSPRMQQIQDIINAKLPGRVCQITSRDKADNVFVVTAIADRIPPSYYIYNHAKGTFGALPDPYPWLRKTALQPTQVIRWKARDGLKLQGYLTLPAKRSDGGKPPLVVLAHGGPWARDEWGFNPEVQFLATRGYAVFQPNYRGSTGFSNAISREQAYDFKAMHDDVTDGVQQLARSGLIDPQRIAAMGGSFGGFLAVSGAAFEPGLYKCAVTIVGVFDWEKIVKQRNRDRFDKFNYEILLQKLGDPKVAKEKFDAISPLRHAGNINIPVYISAGEYDPRVDASQSKELYAELKKRNVPVEQFIADKEGHGYFETKSRIRLYQEIASFLERYL
jgi:acetyl esterase/lipase